MNQLPLEFDRRHTAMVFIESRPELFREGFEKWLIPNWLIYQRFEFEANRVWRTGRRHYSAHTIIEWLRHYTLMSDNDSEFKLNEAWTSSIARLYVLMNEGHADLFEFRERRDGVVKAPLQAGAA